MHVETYPTFSTPRDEELSLSSSEENSSEFDWLESKIIRKQKYIWKAEQVLCIFLPFQNYTKDYIYDRYMIDISVKEITKLYIRGYSPFFQT